MENQHRMIAGYRELGAVEIATMNELKVLEDEVRYALSNINCGDDAAKRWLAIARTHLETGFMFAIKAVAQPTNGLGRS